MKECKDSHPSLFCGEYEWNVAFASYIHLTTFTKCSHLVQQITLIQNLHKIKMAGQTDGQADRPNVDLLI